ncbi:hypothetical protein IT396_02505 [Candidatus Nomurabacteria bacterium]|nr:hypothetical protein [Candidatus Nomurabacteria bacterium]
MRRINRRSLFLASAASVVVVGTRAAVVADVRPPHSELEKKYFDSICNLGFGDKAYIEANPLPLPGDGPHMLYCKSCYRDLTGVRPV